MPEDLAALNAVLPKSSANKVPMLGDPLENHASGK